MRETRQRNAPQVENESRVHEFVPNRRIGRFDDGTFLLLGTNEGCHIVTEEVVKGSGAVEFREKQPNVMHEGQDLRLRSPKPRSEH